MGSMIHKIYVQHKSSISDSFLAYDNDAFIENLIEVVYNVYWRILKSTDKIMVYI